MLCVQSGGGSAQEVPVQSVSLSAVTMTLNESESKTLTATVLPANATDRAVVWSVLPTGLPLWQTAW